MTSRGYNVLVLGNKEGDRKEGGRNGVRIKGVKVDFEGMKTI